MAAGNVCTENFVKFPHVVFDVTYVSRQTDILTADSQYFASLPGEQSNHE